MKGNNGITLISLVIYIIAIVIVITIISNISASMYNNLNDFDKESESAVEFSKFNMYFLSDIKKENAKIKEASQDYIIIQTNNEIIEYQIQGNSIYRNKTKICNNVGEFLIIQTEGEKEVTIQIKIGDYKKTTTYTTEEIKIESLNIII